MNLHLSIKQIGHLEFILGQSFCKHQQHIMIFLHLCGACTVCSYHATVLGDEHKDVHHKNRTHPLQEQGNFQVVSSWNSLLVVVFVCE